MSAEQIQIMSEVAIRFALTAVLTMISAIAWKRSCTADTIAQGYSIGRSFACAPYPVRAIVFWGLIEVVFSIWWKVSSELPVAHVVAIVTVYMLKWVIIVLCMLKGHKWPRFYFLIAGGLTLVDGMVVQIRTHAVSASSLNHLLNGFLGIVLYYLLTMDGSIKWRDTIRAVPIKSQNTKTEEK